MRFDFIYNMSPNGKEWLRLLSIIHDLPTRVIHERREALLKQQQQKGDANVTVDPTTTTTSTTKKKKNYIDFLDILLTSKDENNEPLSSQEIHDEVETFMFEGHDTTTTGIVWALYNIARHPEVEKKLLKELDEAFPVTNKTKSGSDDGEAEEEEVEGDEDLRVSITNDDLGNLRYLNMVIKESMRSHPPVSGVARALTEEIEICGHKIPAGMTVEVNPWLVHHNEEHWPNPFVFDPERWADDSIERHPYSYIPFSAGPRNCIGQQFALHEMKAVIANIYRNFTLKVVEDQSIRLEPALVTRPKFGIKMTVHKRF
eukprot:TRINITY_DN1016_c0_g1_i1.p1 TRINITY_DN1016_c0_g1~~TRINITY_DN1016_c0_g1_i1.p1  ORF type:complete len:315 (-),score=117.30 TRINITY_DN1016_c0_g1_i1:68-1012(-)